MFPITLTINDKAQLDAVLAALYPTADKAPAPAPAPVEPPAAAAAPTPVEPPAAAGEAFQYKTLQALVLKLLPTHGDALGEIAKRHGQPHGATTFKGLPPECWEAAYADVKALETASV